MQARASLVRSVLIGAVALLGAATASAQSPPTDGSVAGAATPTPVASGATTAEPPPAASSLAAPAPAEAPPAAEASRPVALPYNVGVPLYTHNFTNGTNVSIADRLAIAEFVGAHYFITEHVRLGMMVQFTEQVTGAPPAGGDRWSTFSLLPQVGWHFYKRLYMAGIFTYSPRSGGKNETDLGVQYLFGGSLPITDYASLGLALEIPVNFKVATTIGFTPLIGLTVRL